jgi:hypothetical protein
MKYGIEIVTNIIGNNKLLMIARYCIVEREVKLSIFGPFYFYLSGLLPQINNAF